MKKNRKILLSLMLGAFSFSGVFAQAGSYSFTASSGTYTPLVGGIAEDGVEADSYLSGDLPIGFTFNFDGTDYTTLRASSNGFLSFGTGTSSQTTNNLDAVAATSRPLVAPLWDDHDGNSAGATSEASYLVSGTAPNRVFTFEWLNWEWRYNSNDPVISFQVKLYETTNAVEFVYQQEIGAVATGSASIGITGVSTFLSLDGTGATPNASNTTETASLSTKPATGQVYSFMPPTCVGPSGLAAANLLATSADLSWTQLGGATDWIVETGASGFTPSATTVNATTTPTFSASGLTATTDYEFYVRAVCGLGDTSAWAGPFAFTTPCLTIIPDYTQPFATFLPDACWDEAGDGTIATGPSTFGTGLWGASTILASNGAKINLYTNNRTDWILSPNFDLSGGTYEVKLDVAVTSYNGSAVATMGSDDEVVLAYTEDGTTWNAIKTWNLSDNVTNTFTEFSFPVVSVGTNVQFAIYGTDGAVNDPEDYDFHITNFVVQTPPACAVPNTLTASNVTATGADLGWTETGSATNWIVEAGAPGFTPSATTVTTTNPEAISGLTATTDYEFYVRAVCGLGDTSAWAGPFAFTTPCASIVAPWLEQFDGTANPVCWSETGPSAWEYGTPAYGASSATDYSANGGNAPFMDGSDNTNGEVSALISPLVDISGLANPQLRYYIFYNNTTNAALNKLIVELYDGSAWVVVDSIQENLGTDWVERNTYIGLSGMTITGDVQIRFTVTGDNSMGGNTYNNDIVIDDVELFDGPACPNPSDIVVTYPDNDSAVVNWTLGYSETMWNVEVGAAGYAPGTGAEVYASSGMNDYDTITGLVQLTDYDVYVQADCGADSSSWVGPITFTTLANCPDISGFTLDYVTADSIVVSWTSNGSETMWDVEFGPAGFAQGAGTIDNLTATVDTVGGLMTETTYDFYVRSDCGGTDQGVWQGPFTVTTSCSPIAAFPYLEDFEGTYPGWRVVGTNTTWEIGMPAGSFITSAANGSNAAVTNLTGNYNNSENGFLETACFDFTALTNPVLEFNLIHNTENNYDEVWVDVTIDEGATWTRLGNSTSGYSNWYNDAGNNWWEASSAGWVSAAHELSAYAGESNVRFRIAFSSDGSVNGYDGGGVDDFSIVDETCPRTTDLVFNSAITDTLAFGWTSNGSETMWNVEYGPVGFTPGTGTTYSTMNNPDTLFGLPDGTLFDIYVTSDCGGGDEGVQQGPLSVATPLLNDFTCDAIFVPADGSTSYFSNFGATQQPGEPYQGNGHSVWFKTVVPASGHLAIGTCGNDANTQLSTYGYHIDCTDSLWMNNFDNTTFNPWGCDLNSPAGNEYCGLTANDTVYFSITTFGADAIFPVKAWDLQYEAGTGSPVTVCVGDVIDLGPLLTGSSYEYTGYFDYLSNPAVIVDDTTAATANFTFGNDSVVFIVENSCMADTATIMVDAVAAPNTGISMDPFDACNTGDVFLMNGLTGTVDGGGTWSDDDATGLLVGNIYVANGQATGTYNFTYTVDNGICPAESNQLTVTLNDCVGVEESTATFGLYPNPNNGAFSISSNVTEVATLQVLDTQGKVVYNRQINLTAGVSSDVKLSNVTAGIYMVRLVTESSVSVQNIMVK